MKKFLIVISLMAISCGEPKNDKKADVEQAPDLKSIPLLQGVSELSLWDYSSEKRCDGIKEYLTVFGSQRLVKGVVNKFSCKEIIPGSEQFSVAAEFSFDNQKSLVVIVVAREISQVNFCLGEFKDNPMDITCTIDRQPPLSTGDKKTILRTELPDYMKTFVGFKQSKELIYGMTASDFYSSAVVELSSSEGVPVSFKDQSYLFFLSLEPSVQEISRGQVRIERIEPESGYQIFGCSDSSCIRQKVFEYQIRQHWFTFLADRKLSAFVIPKP